MSEITKRGRRNFLKSGLVGSATLGGCAAYPAQSAHIDPLAATRPFYGKHQSGIADAAQKFTYVAVFDLNAEKRSDVIALLQAWTGAAARLTHGDTAAPMPLSDDGARQEKPDPDSGEALDLGPAGLTITFGFGPGVFIKNGADRYGLAHLRPDALVDLPRFNGDRLIFQKTGGELLVQACADDPQVAFHAIRQLARIAYDVAPIRWAQAGFLSGSAGKTPRNLMGFKDGTVNPAISSSADMNRYVWADPSATPWMANGTYTVVRKIDISLEHWDRTERGTQEQIFGREKYSGAPLGKHHEFDDFDFDAVDSAGHLIVPESSHSRLSHPSMNNGMQILRRSYSYNDAPNFQIERWPPWSQEIEYDAGLVFIAHQRDPRTGFIPINDRLAKSDMLNEYITHTGSGIFACPPGPAPGSYIGATLFES